MSEGRQHPAHHPVKERHNEPIIVFLTVCSKDRKHIFASADTQRALEDAWHKAKTWRVGRYVIMPDHIHIFRAPNGTDIPSLERWMRYWKSVATKRIGAKGGDVWQRDRWDRQLRSAESYSDKWEYVRRNPVRQGYCDDPDEWPYQGELNILQW